MSTTSNTVSRHVSHTRSGLAKMVHQKSRAMTAAWRQSTATNVVGDCPIIPPELSLSLTHTQSKSALARMLCNTFSSKSNKPHLFARKARGKRAQFIWNTHLSGHPFACPINRRPFRRKCYALSFGLLPLSLSGRVASPEGGAFLFCLCMMCGDCDGNISARAG